MVGGDNARLSRPKATRLHPNVEYKLEAAVSDIGSIQTPNMSAHSSFLRYKFAPWTVTSSAMDNFIKSYGPGSDPQATPCPNWRLGKLEELSTVNVTVSDT